MFCNALHRLHETPERDVFASFNGYARRWWTTLAFLALPLLIALDNTILDALLPSLPDQLGAEDSGLRWIDRAKAITVLFQIAAETVSSFQSLRTAGR